MTVFARQLIPLLLSLSLVGCGDCGQTSSNSSSPDSDGLPDMDRPGGQDVLAPIVMITSSTSSSSTGAYTLTGTAVDDTGIASLSYTLDGGAPQPLTLMSDTSFSLDLLLPSTTTLTVIARDASNNEGSQTIQVSHSTLPELDAQFTVEGMPWLHEPLIFDASQMGASPDPALTFTWDFGDGTSAEGSSLAHAFHDPRAYTVTLTVTAQDGRRATASREVTIAPPMAQGSALITGYVTDEHGFALPHVDLFLAEDPSTPIARTDLRGRYTLTLGAGIASMVSFRKAGWADQLQRIALPSDATEGGRDVSMRRVGTQLVIEDLMMPTNLELHDGTRIALPAQPFVYANDDQPVVGQALVAITPITPENGQVSGFPGSFSALRQGSLPTALATHGAVEVTLSQGGEPLKLAPGVTATLDIPLGTDADLGQTIDLWSLDPRNGYWIWEGTGEVVTSPMNHTIKVLRATVSHFSTWNADEPIALRNVTLSLSTSPLDAPALDLMVKTQGQSDQGAVTQGTTATHKGLGQEPGASRDIEVSVPVDYNTRIEVGSEQGCLYGSAELDSGSTADSLSLSLQRTDDPLNPVPTLLPGTPQTFNVQGVESEQLIVIQEQPGQYWRLTARATSAHTTGYVGLLAGCGGTSVARLLFDETKGESSIVIEPGPSALRALVLNPAGLDNAEVELTLEALDAPSSPDDSALGQQQSLIWQDNSTHDSWVYMNAGQIAHIALGGAAPPNASLSFVTPSGDTRAPLSAPFTPTSKRFTATESGWHLFVLNPRVAPPSGAQAYTLTLGEVLPELSLTYQPRPVQHTFLDALRDLGTGDVQRFTVRKPGDHVLFMRPMREASSLSGLAPRLGGDLSTVRAPDDTFESYALADQTSDVTLNFFLYTPDFKALTYTLDTNMIQRDQSSIRVGDVSCGEPDTTSALLGAAALGEGGTLELCGGRDHEFFDGLNLKQRGLRIKGLTGDMVTPPSLKAWPDQAFIKTAQRHIVELSNLDVVMTGLGLDLRLDDASLAPFIFEDLTFTGAANAGAVLRVQGTNALDWTQVTTPTRFAHIDVQAAAPQGLYLERLQDLVVDDLTITAATDTGLYANNVSRSTFSNLTLADAVRALDLRGTMSYQNVLDGITTSHAAAPTLPTANTESIRVYDSPPPGSPLSTLIIRNVQILLGYRDQTGLLVLNSGQEPTSTQLDSVFIDGQELERTRGIVITASSSQNVLKLVNSVIRDVARSALEVSGAQKFVEIIIAHNTLQLGNSTNMARRDLIDLVSASPSTLLKLVNTIFVGPTTSAGMIVGANLHGATIVAPLGELHHNLFHQVTHPYARQNVAPFPSPQQATDVLGDPMFSNIMLELEPQSPAVDAGIMSNFVVLDYLGVTRPQGAAPDIGAYEQ